LECESSHNNKNKQLFQQKDSKKILIYIMIIAFLIRFFSKYKNYTIQKSLIFQKKILIFFYVYNLKFHDSYIDYAF